MPGLDNFFSKIYVINLFDKTERWEKVRKQFANRRIKVDRFIAIDGRCKDQGEKACKEKLGDFEMKYDVRIPLKKGANLKVMVPAASLTIGTIIILRHTVKMKYPRILICEDDIELARGFEKKFNQGIAELKKIGKENSWDLLYLGCGDRCGYKGVSEKRSKRNRHPSFLNQLMDVDIYVKSPNDIRFPCDECKSLTEHITRAVHPGGTWCYAFSLKGARKMLKLIGNNAGAHIDQLLAAEVEDGKMTAYAFDPPVVMHEAIIGPDGKRKTDIEWEW